jgi:two-component system response regulator RegA
VIAHNYEDAMSEAEAWNPDRATIDLRMPGRGGLELVSALHAFDPTLSIVVLTGYGSIATAVEAVKRGAVQYLPKPAGVQDILNAFEHSDDSGATPSQAPMPLADVAREHLEQVLLQHDGNISQAARALGLHRRTLQRKLKKPRQ